MELIAKEISNLRDFKAYGRVSAVSGLLVECEGLTSMLSIGSRVKVHGKNGNFIPCEVVAFKGQSALMLPFSSVEGIGISSKVELLAENSSVFPCEAWMGRVINAFGEPIDKKGLLPKGDIPVPIKNNPPPASDRKRVAGKFDLGVRALNTFTTLCNGQRIGIFAGSGVGKSMLLAMIAKYSSADVNVIGLIGERGREVQEFLEDYLGEEGLKRTIVIVATSDESALMRKYAAYMTLAVAEYFRMKNKNVMCMMDSVTRFAMAQREIGLSAGEPPASKGYTPTVFSELPRLLERAGPGVEGEGNITGIFTVLVEGGDHDEPVSDAVRGILDGHIVLERKIAERNRYPAINILKSVSRTLPNCNTDDENMLVNRARALLSTYDDMAEMVRLGAYRKGSDPMVDEAIYYYPELEKFLSQKVSEKVSLQEGYLHLAQILTQRN